MSAQHNMNYWVAVTLLAPRFPITEVVNILNRNLNPSVEPIVFTEAILADIRRYVEGSFRSWWVHLNSSNEVDPGDIQKAIWYLENGGLCARIFTPRHPAQPDSDLELTSRSMVNPWQFWEQEVAELRTHNSAHASRTRDSAIPRERGTPTVAGAHRQSTDSHAAAQRQPTTFSAAGLRQPTDSTDVLIGRSNTTSRSRTGSSREAERHGSDREASRCMDNIIAGIRMPSFSPFPTSENGSMLSPLRTSSSPGFSPFTVPQNGSVLSAGLEIPSVPSFNPSFGEPTMAPVHPFRHHPLVRPLGSGLEDLAFRPMDMERTQDGFRAHFTVQPRNDRNASAKNEEERKPTNKRVSTTKRERR